MRDAEKQSQVIPHVIAQDPPLNLGIVALPEPPDTLFLVRVHLVKDVHREHEPAIQLALPDLAIAVVTSIGIDLGHNGLEGEENTRRQEKRKKRRKKEEEKK